MPYSKEEIQARIQSSIELGALDFNTRGGFSETDAFYMSFARDDEWLGGCYIRAESIDEASLLSHALGINPGGCVQFVGPFPAKALNRDYENRLLNKEEIELAVDPRLL